MTEAVGKHWIVGGGSADATVRYDTRDEANTAARGFAAANPTVVYVIYEAVTYATVSEFPVEVRLVGPMVPQVPA